MALALVMALQIVFEGAFILSKDIPGSLKWLFEINYAHYALEGVRSLIFGFDRTKLNCNEIYCHFGDPKKITKIIGLSENLPKVYRGLFTSLILVHIAAYCVMRYRLRN